MSNKRKRAMPLFVWVRSGKCVKHDLVSSTSGSSDKLGIFPAELRQLYAILAPLTSSFPQFLQKTLLPQHFLHKSPPTALPTLRQQFPPPLPLHHHDTTKMVKEFTLDFSGHSGVPSQWGIYVKEVVVVLPASWQAGRSSAKGRWCKERSFFCSCLHRGNGSSPH